MSEQSPIPPQFEFDLFISHASEDKERFVRPLAGLLRELGVRVWYDEFSLSIGDRLTRSINRGLAQSRFGVVVLSKAFIAKDWTATELDVLINRQVSTEKLILPIWFGVTSEEVRNYNQIIYDIIAIKTDENDPLDVVFKILKVARPDLYEIRSRNDVMHSDYVKELYVELAERLKETIRQRIKVNGKGEITGQIMQDTLIDVVDFVKSAFRQQVK